MSIRLQLESCALPKTVEETTEQQYQEGIKKINDAKAGYLALACEFMDFKLAHPELPGLEIFFLGITQGDILDALQARGKYLTV